jgi:hypothetical protein
LGSDQAELLLFQGFFAKERCYLAFEPYCPCRNGSAITRQQLSKSLRPPATETGRRCCALKPNLIFTCSANHSLPTAIHPPTSDRLVLPCLRSILFLPIHERWVPRKAGTKYARGAASHSALDRVFRYQKPASKALNQAYIRDFRSRDQSITLVRPEFVFNPRLSLFILLFSRRNNFYLSGARNPRVRSHSA